MNQKVCNLNIGVFVHRNIANQLFVVHQLILLGRNAVILFELCGKIFLIAKIQHIGDFFDGIIAVFQPLLCHFHGGTHDVLIDSLLIGGFENTAGIDGGDVELIGDVCGTEILL